jgi:hypothetical protein
MGLVPPQIRDRNRSESAAPQKKVYIHPDQIFYQNVSGFVKECFVYCDRHDSVPINNATPPAMLNKPTGFILIELGKKAKIMRINHSKTDGEIKVYVGDDFDNLKHRFTIEPHTYHTDCLHDLSSVEGKIIALHGEGARVPYLEFISEKEVRAMPNKPYQKTHSNPLDLIKITQVLREKTKDMAMIQKTVFPKHCLFFNPENIITEENKIRLSPTMINGTPVSYDEALIMANKLWSIVPDAIVEGLNFDLAAFLLARYGSNKNYRYNKAKDKYSIDDEFVFTNNMGHTFSNKNKAGANQIASIGCMPKHRIMNPDEYCEATEAFTNICRGVDIVTPLASLPMKPDRNLFYFVYRYFKKFWADKLRIEIKSIWEAQALEEFLSIVHHYTPGIDIEVFVNYDLEPNKWMSCLCFCGYHRVSSVVFINYDSLFNKIPQKWEIVFEPTDDFHAVVDWVESIKKMNLTHYSAGPAIDKAFFKSSNSYIHIEQYMVNWLTVANPKKLFEREIYMPHEYAVR